MRLVSAKEAKEYFHITGPILYQWKIKGKINAKQLSSKKILYDIDSFEDFQPKQKQNVIYALDWSEQFGLYILKKDCFKFTEYHYNIAKDYLRDINWFHPEYEFTHGGNKKAKKYILEYDYKKRKKSHRETVTLESIVSSLVARGQPYSEVINYPIYVVYNQYYRLVKVDEYQTTIHALYSGCLDTKKNPINWEKINWSSIIK